MKNSDSGYNSLIRQHTQMRIRLPPCVCCISKSNGFPRIGGPGNKDIFSKSRKLLYFETNCGILTWLLDHGEVVSCRRGYDW